MKNLYIIINLFLFSVASSAQNQSIDSLKITLKILPQDTSRIKALNDISTGFIQTNHFDSAFQYAKSAMDLSEKLQYTIGGFYAYHNLATINFHIKEYKTGKLFLGRSLNAALTINDKKNIASIYKELADLYQLQGNFKLVAESKAKFNLYKDSADKEETAKRNAEIAAANQLKEKQKTELAANDAKALAVYEAKKQQVFYISLVVLVVLSILIIWLAISRSKLKAKRKQALIDENEEIEHREILEKSIQQKAKEEEKLAFLQKIAEKETFTSKTVVDKNQFPIATPIKTIIGEKITEEKIDGLEKETSIKDLETKLEVEQQPVEKEVTVIGNNVDANAVEPEKAAAPILGGQYSRIITQSQLLHFNAKMIEEKIKLVWKVADKKNIIRFEVEKSVDNIQYVNVETVNAKGFTGNAYETFDLKPLPGINYYRLEIVDSEGNLIYSPVAQIEVLPATTLDLICYPTHVKDVIMVTAAGGKSMVLVNIFNASGKKELTIEIPPKTTPIYLTSLAIGTYTLQMKCQGKTVLQQLVKVA